MAHHRVEQIQRVAEIIAEVFARLRHRFFDTDERRKMHHRVELRGAEHTVENAAVAEVAELDAAAENRVAMAGTEIVENGDIVAAFDQQLNHVRPAVTGPTT